MTARQRIGVDIGGTFTDVVAVDDAGGLRIAKVPSTRSDPSAAVRTVLADLLPAWAIAPPAVERFVHGTTVATNAVLERKGAKLGLLATEGFTDVLEIGRQNRRQLYDLILRPETPGFLAPGVRRRGVVESIGPGGEVSGVTAVPQGTLSPAVIACVKSRTRLPQFSRTAAWSWVLPAKTIAATGSSSTRFTLSYPASKGPGMQSGAPRN